MFVSTKPFHGTPSVPVQKGHNITHDVQVRKKTRVKTLRSKRLSEETAAILIFTVRDLNQCPAGSAASFLAINELNIYSFSNLVFIKELGKGKVILRKSNNRKESDK